MMALLRPPQTTRRKRSFSSGEDEDDEEEEEEEEGGAKESKTPPRVWTPDAHPHKKAKSRKPTYLVRKEEKDVLQLQVQQLQAQVDYLRERSGIVDWQSQEFQMQQKKIVNDILRESVRNQQLSVFSAQSVVSELMTLGERCPIDTHIRLTSDWAKRRETLVALKAQKLHDAQRLLEKRTQFMDASRERREDTSFVTESGDYCSIAFQSVPLSGVRCVKQVYDTLHHRVQNLERSVGEAMGIVLTCDGDDNWDKTILHRRLVHSSVRDVLSESNYVVFSEFIDDESKKGRWSREKAASSSSSSTSSVGKELGLFVLDYVDEDELYPYRSGQCMRHDVTGVISLRAVSCKENGSVVVVMTKWLMLRLRHNSSLNVSELKLQELKARIQQVGNALVQNVHESAALPSSDLPNAAAAAAVV